MGLVSDLANMPEYRHIVAGISPAGMLDEDELRYLYLRGAKKNLLFKFPET